MKRIYITKTERAYVTDEKNKLDNGNILMTCYTKEGIIQQIYSPSTLKAGEYLREVNPQMRGAFDTEEFSQIEQIATLTDEEYRKILELNKRPGCFGVFLNAIGIKPNLEKQIIRHLKKD